jgi:long-subunit fatty acid transport protein
MVLAFGGFGKAMAGELPNTEAFQGLQFNLSPPGARSLGMAGAFIGRADDATAAFANPAGLVNLFSAEIAVEGRSYDFDTPYTSGGDYPDDLEFGSASSDASNLSFASFVYPGNDWVFSVYHHQYMDFNTAFNTGVIALGEGVGFTRPTENSMDVDITNTGLSLAYRFSDRFSVGLGFSYYDFSLEASGLRKNSEGTLLSSQNQTGSDDDYGFNLGLQLKATENLSIGLVYRSAPEFDAFHTSVARDPENPEEFVTRLARDFMFEPPDLYGIGFSWAPANDLTINFDVSRVNYSNLASPTFYAFKAPPLDPDEMAAAAKVSFDDGTEVRLGAEYVISSLKTPVALRAGLWHDPAHFLEFKGSPTPEGAQLQSAFDAFYQGGDDEIHYTVGLGVVFSRFQLDAAADFSDIQNVFSISGVFFFN